MIDFDTITMYVWRDQHLSLTSDHASCLKGSLLLLRPL